MVLAPGWWVGQAFRVIPPFDTQDIVQLSAASHGASRWTHISRSSPGLASDWNCPLGNQLLGQTLTCYRAHLLLAFVLLCSLPLKQPKFF